MSEVRPDIDLAGLARPETRAKPPPRRRLRILLPLAILLVFGAILYSTLGDLLRGAVEVSTVRPRVLEDAPGSLSAGAVAFQAAGWIEPDPFPVHATALVPGVVAEVLVLEGAQVRKGDAVARLFDEEAHLAQAAADAALARAQADAARAEVDADFAQRTLDAALAVTEAARSARAELDGKRAELASREAAALEGEARLRVAQEELVVQEELLAADAAGPRAVELAQARVQEARSALDVLRADAALVRAEVERAAARNDRASADLELRLEDRLRRESAQAALTEKRAIVREAEVARDQAALRLERTTVRAPTDGIVLERHVAPGEVLEAGAVGTPVLSLYDPASLRVRVDVPQSEIGKVAVGGRAAIQAETRPGKPYAGEVVRVVHRADIQKVTLQVHVRVLDGDALLRPEMLCQVRFLSAAPAGARPGGATVSGRVAVPLRLLDGDRIWVIDGASGTAMRRKVERGAELGEWIEIASGINASDKLIDHGREGLSEGARVHVHQEE